MLFAKFTIYLPILLGVTCDDSIKDLEHLLAAENYNKTWIYFPDDESNIHKAIIDSPQVRMPLIQTDVPTSMTFTLYTRDTPLGEDVLWITTEFREDSMDFSLPIKIITHGWMSSGNKSACTEIKEAYLKQGEYNVIVVDWAPIANSPFYIDIVYNMEDLGTEMAKFVDCLIFQGANPDKIHLIGHSMGAHIVGVAGKRLGLEKVHRVTGLDPAGPLFYWDSIMLSKSSAEFVDVIHTTLPLVGHWGPLGTADFYPNGGSSQPGCSGFLEWDALGCDHSKSWKYFRTSITHHHRFLAQKCESFLEFMENECQNGIVYMGDSVPTNISGVYYLQTGNIE